MPEVSVIIPYYKKISHINNAIDSVLNQTFKDFEIILIYDDENLEDLVEIEKKYKSNNKIKIFKNNKNCGAGLSRNIGIKYSSGEIVAFIDSDDYWLPQKLEYQLSFMKKNNHKFIICNYKKNISEKKSLEIINNKSKITYNDLLKSCDIGLSTVLLKKNIIDENLFPSTKTKEDFIAWLKITKNNTHVFNLNMTLVEWNQVKGSLSSNFFQKMFDGFKVYYVYEKFSFIKSLYYLFLLSFNSLKKKI